MDRVSVARLVAILVDIEHPVENYSVLVSEDGEIKHPAKVEWDHEHKALMVVID